MKLCPYRFIQRRVSARLDAAWDGAMRRMMGLDDHFNIFDDEQGDDGLPSRDIAA